ncbi:MAG: cation diffusion facilitator family transporter [Frankiaceae bacterium]
MSAGEEGGGKAIVAALIANLGIAISKFVAFLITGSSSMLAESVHSVADTGNQGLLLVGRRRSKRPPDEDHPFGHGQDRYFYAFVVALVLFSVGSLFALYEGYEKVKHPHELDSPIIAIGVLAVAIGLEGFSFHTAFTEASKIRGNIGWAAYLRTSKSPELPVVLLEDTAALLGLLFALGGVGLSITTGNPRWDGVGTLAIGLLLGAVAVFLAMEMKSLLIGEAASRPVVAGIRAALTDGTRIRDVIHLRTMHLGPEQLLVGAKVALAPGLTMPEVAEAIDDAEARIRAAQPLATLIYIEPDLYRPQLADGARQTAGLTGSGGPDPER